MSSSDANSPATLIAVPEPPPAPRGVTPRAARRAWQEPRVRAWLIAAAALLLVAGYNGAVEAWKWSTDSQLVREGTVVDAVVWERGYARVKGRPQPPNGAIELVFQWQGEPRSVYGRLVGRDEPTFAGQTVPLHVDPQDLTRWTLRTTPPRLTRYLVNTFVLTALALPLLTIAIFSRRRVLRTWRSGEARQAVVVETHHTALAPLSAAVRCTLAEGSDRRLLTVYVPHSTGKVQRGDVIWLVMPPRRPEKAVAARLYA